MGDFLTKCFILIITLTAVISIQSRAQYKIPLSEKHQQKIEKIKDPRKRLAKYRKYYSKDSIKYLRILDRQLKQKSDSIYAVMRRLEGKKQEIVEKVRGHKIVNKAKVVGLTSPVSLKEGNLPALKNMDMPTNQVERIGEKLNEKEPLSAVGEISQKATSGLKSSVSELTSKKNKITPYQQYYNEYKEYLNNPDSMRVMIEKVAEKELEQSAQKMVGKANGMGGTEQFQQQKAVVEEIQKTPKKYQQQLEQYGDKKKLMEEGKQKAKDKAIEFLNQHKDKISEIQKKMSKLKKVYSKVENSNDLSTAVKRSSLKGKPFKERLYIGANFQVINLDPFSLDFSPALGYMFNKKFIMGIGATYRHTFGEYEPNQTTLPENQYAFNAFIQHDLIKGLFGFATFEQSNRELLDQNSDTTTSAWVPGFMAGIGKTFNVHPSINTRILVLYNFLHEPGESPYKSPWILKAGFQLKKSN